MHDTHEKKAFSTLLLITFILSGIIIYSLIPKEVSEPVTNNSQESSQRALVSAPKFGSASPEAILIEFGDFQCPACQHIAAHISTLEEEYGDRVQFIWIHAINPAQHQFARTAAIASQCAHEQNKFKPFHDKLFEEQSSLGPNLYAQIAGELNLDIPLFNACLSSESSQEILTDHQRFSEVSRIEQTPTIAINDKFITGDLSLESLKAEIESALSAN